MINHFLGVGLVLALFFFRNESRTDLRYFKDYFFIILTVLSLMTFGVQTIKRKLWPIIVLVIYSFLFIQKSDNFPIYYQWTLFIFGMLLMYQLSSIKLDSNLILNYISIAVLVSSVWCILEYYQIDVASHIYVLLGSPNAQRVKMVNGVLTKVDFLQVAGPLGQQTITGALIGSGIIAMFRKRWIFLFPIGLIGLYLCSSAMSTISFATTLFIFICSKIKDKKVLAMVISASMGVAVLIYENFTHFFDDSGRFVTWEKILQTYGFNFWGKSNGWFWAVSNIKNPMGERFAHAHCEPMEVYIAFGIIGIILTLVLLSRIRLKNTIIFCILSGLIINSLANLTFHISVLSYVGIICYSILTCESMEDSNGHFNNKNQRH